MGADLNPGTRSTQLLQSSFLYGGNAVYIEDLYARYQADPTSVAPEWRVYFAELPDASPAPRAPRSAPVAARPLADVRRATLDSVRALDLIHAYRLRGHSFAQLDPLTDGPPPLGAELAPASYGFADADLDREVFIDHELGLEFATVRTLTTRLRATYCSTIGFELMHISNAAERSWMQAQIERAPAPPSAAEKRALLQILVEVKGYERYLDKKFTGAKRFGLAGAESTIPALEEILKRGAALGVREVVIGMAHRGRLNVLGQVLRKPARAIFSELMGGSFLPDDVEGSGDVNYHLGASSDRELEGHAVHLSLTANPSHLEISDPVVLGKVRAKQDRRQDVVERTSVLPLLIHGDAAFAGQGVVAECFGLSGLEGHRTGGSVHLIINNQIGFTTDPNRSRSSPYPSDLAKMIEAPVLHVNGDDPEAVVRAAAIAIEFRQRFHKPVVIDLVCFRLYGHNEGDEPAFTQPLMYRRIRAHRSTLEIYGDRLVAEGVTTPAAIARQNAEWIAQLDAELEAAKSYTPGKADWLEGAWFGLKTTSGAVVAPTRGPVTGAPLETLRTIGTQLTQVGDGFHLHPTVARFLEHRRAAIESGHGLDWATAEALALGSLLDEGHPVRLVGQDSERGTFTQRHAVLIDQEDGRRYMPLGQVRAGQPACEIVNSMLSEEAVLGFEYGYSLAQPNALVLWEAQFGDFANGAQVLFDQFLSSSERKWLRMSGLVCLLPHGLDGQGPEHSSARLERYLQSCAEDNWQVVNCTTPANYFHVLRRQLKRDFRKPLILMTPKSLLRHRRCKSELSELSGSTSFQCVLGDDAESRSDAAIKLRADGEIRRVVLCSGKVYYDLYEEREKRGLDDIYLLRVEQLYPFPMERVAAELGRFPDAEIVWCQEEPQNMGAWSFIEPYLEAALARAQSAATRARYAGRPAAAAPATGQTSRHAAQLASLLEQALGRRLAVAAPVRELTG